MTNTASHIIKLNESNLKRLSPEVQAPGYDRRRINPSIVHVGVGGFHRSHQAVYVTRR